MKKRAVIYARYSAGPKQTEQSIEGQVRVCRDFAQQKGLVVQEVYADRHISGKTDKRPEFQRLIMDAQERKFDAVIVYKTDRFSRSKYDAAIYKKVLELNKVKLYYAAEPIPEGSTGVLVESLMEGLAQYYSTELAEKIKRGMHEGALKRKVHGKSPGYGYRKALDGTYEVDEAQAEMVREIFRRYIAGEAAASIARDLNQRGTAGIVFRKSTLPRILNCPKYYGLYQSGDVVIEDGIPSIISRETFDLAQAEMRRRGKSRVRRTEKVKFLLSGKCTCGYCGGEITGVSGTSKIGKLYHYYRCRNAKTCGKAQVPKEKLEALVADLTEKYILRTDHLHVMARELYEMETCNPEGEAREKELRGRIAEIDKAIKNLMKATEYGKAVPTLLARIEELEEERHQVNLELRRVISLKFELSEEELYFFLLNYINSEYEGLGSPEERLIPVFVTQVILYDDKIRICYNLDIKEAPPEGCLYDLPSSFVDSLSGLNDSLNEHARLYCVGKVAVLEVSFDPHNKFANISGGLPAYRL